MSLSPRAFVLAALLFAAPEAQAARWRCLDWLYAAGSVLLESVRPTPKAKAVQAELAKDWPDWPWIRRTFARLDAPSAQALAPVLAEAGFRREWQATEAAEALATEVAPPALLGVATRAVKEAATTEDDDRFRAVALFYAQLLNAPSALYLIEQYVPEDSSAERRRLLLLWVTVALARGETAGGWSQLSAGGNEDLGALLTWLEAKTVGRPEPMTPAASGALSDALPRLPAKARATLYRWTTTDVDPRVIAALLARQLPAETDASAWESALETYATSLENVAANETLRKAFAKGTGFRAVESAPVDLRSREVRWAHGFADTAYDTTARNAPYWHRYHARLDRIEKAKRAIAAEKD